MQKDMNLNDGVHSAVPREKMSESVKKIRDFYEMKKNASIYQTDFGFYSLDRWKREGYINENTDLDRLFRYDEAAKSSLGQLGWCEAQLCPQFEEKILEDRGDYELVRDYAGRSVLYFKGRRNGFMPEYVDHPVKDMYSWEKNCKWRLDPNSAERYTDLDERMEQAKKCMAKGMIICQNVIGGYMYLRSLIGPIDLLYKFYDEPALIHDCMKTWFELADTVIARHQEYVTIDELFFGEDICYNHGPLISPDMIKEFLFPYYQQLFTNIKSRQIDKNRHLYFQIDTDGNVDTVIPLYMEIGTDTMSPFEVASGSDVVKIGREYPKLRMKGGIDKRRLAEGKDSIDRMVDSILPIMKKRGGYIPTCDHGVPEEVSFENYMHFRERILEY